MPSGNYLSIPKFAIENIHKITSPKQISDHFNSELQNITKQRHDELDTLMDPVLKMAVTDKYLGQENHFFKFKDDGFNGEISLDLIPKDHSDCKYVPAGRKKEEEIEKKLVNFRCQLFSNSLLQIIKLKKKHKLLLKYIVELHGRGNNTEQDLGLARLLGQQNGKNVTCWHFFIEKRLFVITLYFTSAEPTPFSAFSVSEELEYKLDSNELEK
ncbi:hypothetical protein K8R32_03830 [bacterium]|nr:hypothetical protein [bacterium]